MPPTVVRSYSKINLGLRIGPPRPDGFHALTTLYQTVALHDRVHVEARRADTTAITLSSDDARVPLDARNTAWKMVDAALRAMGVSARVHVHLEKRLPPQGGMGAGSANAAAALLGLERQLGLALPGPDRLRMAEAVGSDVPLFLIGGTVYGHDRGQRVVPYPDLPELPCVVVAPLQGSSTPAAFRAWDAGIARLTPEAAQDRLSELSRVYSSAFASMGTSGTLGVSTAPGTAAAVDESDGDLAGNPLSALVRTGIGNDFEEVVFPQNSSLCAIKSALAGEPDDAPALCAMLSGSGSSLFGLFRTDAEAAIAQARVAALSTGARTFVTRTVDRARYWREMFEE